MRISLLVGAVVALTAWTAAAADDWPQWMGPKRDGVWRESGILERFPPGGLKVRWRSPVALGYAGPAVAKGRVYVADYVRESGDISNNAGKRDKLTGKERVLCLSTESGELVWEYAYDRPYRLSYPGGPRCTPAVAEGKVYSLGAEGNLVCLDTRNGREVWKKDLTKAYKTETPIWGFAGHPLVEGNLLYCLVGGEGSVVVAFDKDTGKEVWKALSAAEPGYCAPTLIHHGGVRQLIVWHPESINSLNPETGESYWSLPLKPDYGMSIAVPRKDGPYLYAAGIRAKGALIKLLDDRPAAEIVWRGKTRTAVYSATATPFVEDGTVYGSDSQTGTLIAARLTDGERLWQTSKATAGVDRADNATVFLVKHEDRFFLFSETGDLILAHLTPEGYEELSRFHVLEPTSSKGKRKVVWSHPAFAEKCVFARNDREIVCVELAATP